MELPLERETEGFEKNVVDPPLRGKSCANECNESSLSYCRVQPALSINGGLVGFRKKHILSEIRFKRQPLKAK